METFSAIYSSFTYKIWGFTFSSTKNIISLEKKPVWSEPNQNLKTSWIQTKIRETLVIIFKRGPNQIYGWYRFGIAGLLCSIKVISPDRFVHNKRGGGGEDKGGGTYISRKSVGPTVGRLQLLQPFWSLFRVLWQLLLLQMTCFLPQQLCMQPQPPLLLKFHQDDSWLEIAWAGSLLVLELGPLFHSVPPFWVDSSSGPNHSHESWSLSIV